MKTDEEPTTCTTCHRVVLRGHVNDKGQCVNCAPAPKGTK